MPLPCCSEQQLPDVNVSTIYIGAKHHIEANISLSCKLLSVDQITDQNESIGSREVEKHGLCASAARSSSSSSSARVVS